MSRDFLSDHAAPRCNMESELISPLSAEDQQAAPAVAANVTQRLRPGFFGALPFRLCGCTGLAKYRMSIWRPRIARFFLVWKMPLHSDENCTPWWVQYHSRRSALMIPEMPMVGMVAFKSSAGRVFLPAKALLRAVSSTFRCARFASVANANLLMVDPFRDREGLICPATRSQRCGLHSLSFLIYLVKYFFWL